MSTTKIISAERAAEIVGVSARRITQLATTKRIPGAKKISGAWMIPSNFEITVRPTKIGARAPRR